MNTTIKIHFTDQKTLEFLFTAQPEETASIGSTLEKLKSQANLIFEADGRLYIVPTNNIKFIEVTPTPPKLPNHIIRNATVRF